MMRNINISMLKRSVFLVLGLVTFCAVSIFGQSCLPDGIELIRQSQIDSFRINYPDCTIIEGDVLISESEAGNITNLDSLLGLREVGGNFSVINNTALLSFKGLDELIGVVGDVQIVMNSMISNFSGLSDLEVVGQSLTITDNGSISSLIGLTDVSQIGGDLNLGRNASLNSMFGFNSISIIQGEINIFDNLSLSGIDELNNIENYIGTINLNLNESLSSCATDFICGELEDDNTTVSIFNNGPSCTNVDEVESICFEPTNCEAQFSEANFDFNACSSMVIAGTNKSYSEFTADITILEDCPIIEIESGYLYRNDPSDYPHSCTPGMNGSVAVCVSARNGCTYEAGAAESVIIDVRVIPGSNGEGKLSGISFYEQSPADFFWIDGETGLNNRPLNFGLRVLKGADEIYSSPNNSTNISWAYHDFSFSNNPEFTVNDETVFRIEILSYCPIGNGSSVRAWDLEDLQIRSNCEDPVSGGSLSLDGGGTEITICAGDGVADPVNVDLIGNEGSQNAWIITDQNNNILDLPTNPPFDFEGAGGGICLIWNVAYEGNLIGLSVGDNIEDLEGCFNLSNSITVTRNAVAGGSLTGGPFSFCVDGVADFVSGITLTDNEGQNSSWIVTDETGSTILGLPADITEVNFDDAGIGTCLIWNISYADGLTGLVESGAVSDITGCFQLSNSITVERSQVEGGEVTGGPFDFCVGDGVPDFVSGVSLSGNTGSNSQWVVTDAAGSMILGLPANPEDVDFDGAGDGTCLIWHLSYDGMISGLLVDGLVSDLAGCFDFSNAVVVTRTEVNGGNLAGGPFTFCVDGIPDFVLGIELSGNTGANSTWVITNEDTTTILGLPMNPFEVDFDAAGEGVCLLWHISYDDDVTGLEENGAVADIEGCFDLSNAITVSRNGPSGGSLSGGPYEFCVGDGIPDFALGIDIMGNEGSNSQWLITDSSGDLILGLPDNPEAVDFDGAGLGTCLIWHVSFEDGVMGLEVDSLVSNLTGCFDLSDSLVVVRTEANGGTITGGPFSFCVGDGEVDTVSGIDLTGNSGENSDWIITTEDSIIITIVDDPTIVNFDGAGPGVCLIWHISSSSGVSGLEIDGNLSDISGCFSLSNSIAVNRSEELGGILSGGPFVFCVGDGEADFVSGLSLIGADGTNLQWLITDEMGDTILGLPANPEDVDFDGAGNGVCLIWNISYADGLEGLEVDSSLNNLIGCFALSNSVSVTRSQADGGMISGGPFSFCVGDGEEDNATGITLTGNSGTNSQWVITNEAADTILGLPTTPGAVDFDGAGVGTCLIWHLSYEDGLIGLEVDSAFANVMGCFDLSNSISVERGQPDGGVIFGGPFEFCVGDGIPDMVSGITLNGNMGANSQWVITDETGETILGLPSNPELVDFDGAGEGTCRIWHMSYEDGLMGLVVGGTISDLVGCFGLSNAIVVERNFEPDCMGGGPMETIVINEIGDNDRVEIKNVSESIIDVSTYWLCDFPNYNQLADLTIICGGDLTLDPDELVVVETSFNIGELDGELGLYTDNNFGSSADIIDYVEWGSTGHQRSTVAVAAGIWTTGDFVPSFNEPMTLNWDGVGNSSDDWFESTETNCDENNIVENADDVLYRIYPNPGYEELNLNMISRMDAMGTVRIYDMLGTLIIELDQLDYDNMHPIQISDLKAGNYFIVINHDYGRSVQMFIKAE